MLPTELPTYPWQTVGSDLFELYGNHYLLVVDYFSRYPEIVRVSPTTSQNVIKALKSVFSRHGIPEVQRSDNGPQYSIGELHDFATSYGFTHVTSSPKFPHSNGLAERIVKTVKQLLSGSPDTYLAPLAYRATPLPWRKLSPTELLMGRRVRTTVPQTIAQLTPPWQYIQRFREADNSFKQRQEADFNKRHRVKELPILPS